MNTINYIQDLQTANHWATETILNLLPQEYLDKELNSSYSNINAILYHLWDAQSVWYNRLTHNANAPLPSKSFNGTYAELKEAILQSYSQYINLLQDKTDDYLSEILTYTNLKGIGFSQPIYQILFQLSHHSAFHRGQIIAFMRQLGYTQPIPQTDVIAWYRLFK